MATTTADPHAYLLAAGAILPPGIEIRDAELDDLEARAYTHPALGAPMVRLSPAKVSRGIDIVMDLLGFDAVGDVTTLGSVRREKLGFPGWALVHDEKNARFALDVLSDLKKATRRIKNKPGYAKEAIDAIGAALSGSVPHFLPSFYEEAARAFIEFDNLKYAQQCFEAARRAEREYALEVDDELREQSFVDFALSGALSVKSLSSFADELVARGKDGLESYLRVCIRRTTGGVPPSPAMLKDLKRLAKSVKVDGDEVHVRFLDAILESPALATAATGFFKAAKKALARMAKRDPEARARILDLFPKWVSAADWMPILQACGALDAIVDPSTDGQSELSTAAWFSRALTRGDSPILRQLLVKAKARLIAEGEALVPAMGRWRGVNIAVAELCLEHGVPISFDRANGMLDFYGTIDDWAQATADEDLPHIAANEEYRKLFVEGCSRLSDYDLRRTANNLDGRPHFAEMLGEGLTRRLERLSSEAVPALKETLGFLGGLPADFWTRYPAARAALERVDVAASLAKSYQIGVFAELAWPKVAALQEREKVKITGFFDQAPHTVLFSDHRVVVLDEDDEVIFDHKAELEPGEKVNRAMWIGGDLCVGFADGFEQARYYWASAPEQRGTAESYGAPHIGHALEDGSLLLRGRPLKRGDSLRYGSYNTMWDGERHYTWHDGKVFEYDPGKGVVGEERGPEFLKNDGEAAWLGFVGRLDVPEGAPIRSRDGLIGVRHRRPGTGSRNEVEDIVGPVGWTQGSRPVAVFCLPGSDIPRVLAHGYPGHEIWCDGVMGSDDDDDYHRANATFPSMSLLRRYQPRDAQTSARLRTIEGAALESLIDRAATAKKAEARRGFTPAPEVKQELEKLFPELEDGKLKTVLLGIAHLAGKLEARRRSLAEKEPDEGESSFSLYAKRVPCDPSIAEALGSFALPVNSGAEPTLISEVDEMRKRFDDPGPDGFQTVVAWGKHSWQLGLGHGTACLYRYACARKGDNQAREGIEAWIRAHAAAGFEGEGAAKIRITFRRQNTQGINQDSYKPTWHVLGENAIFVWQLGYRENAWYTFVEHAPNGAFQVVDREDDDLSGPGLATTALIDEVVAHVAEHGPLPIEAAATRLSEATGLSPAEATLFACANWKGDGFGRVTKGHRAAGKFWDEDPFMQPYPTHTFRQLKMATAVWTKGDWKQLWDPDVLAKRLADAFFEAHPVLPALTADDDEGLETLPHQQREISWAVRAGLDPTDKRLRPTELFSDRKRFFDKNGYQFEGVGFSSAKHIIANLAHALYYAPLASGIVRALPTLWRTVRERQLHPAYFFALTGDYMRRDEPDEGVLQTLRAFGDDIPTSLWRGKRPTPDPKHPCGVPSGDERLIAHCGPNAYYVTLYAHTRALLQPDDPRLAVVSPEDVARASERLRCIFGEAGDGFIALAEELGGKQGRAGDPRVSAPEVVARAVQHLGISEDAATLYLIIAALPKPMDRTVRLLTGWSKKAHEAAGKALLDKELLLEAKRSGSGRSLFLPGAWLKAGAEAWKQGPMQAEPLGHGVLSRDPRAHYAAVFARIEGGDVPRFEEPPKRRGKA